MEQKQALYWLTFSVAGFLLLINLDKSSSQQSHSIVSEIGIVEIAAAALILLIWIWLTKKNSSTKDIRDSLAIVNNHIQNQRITEAQALWPEIELKASRILSERDSLFLTYQALKMQVAISTKNQHQTVHEAFKFLNRGLRRSRKWDELIFCTLSYCNYLESINELTKAYEVLENFDEFADKKSVSSEEISQKLDQLQIILEQS